MEVWMDNINTDEISSEIEEEFFKFYNAGGDISFLLHFPYDIIPPNVQSILDEYLLIRAYKDLEKKSMKFLGDFTVYKDSTVFIQSEDKKDILNKLIEYYAKREEYEKCAKVLKALNKLNSNKN